MSIYKNPFRIFDYVGKLTLYVLIVIEGDGGESWIVSPFFLSFYRNP